MRVVLDSNEYIFAFSGQAPSSTETLFQLVASRSSKCSLHLPRLIVEEVQRNLGPAGIKDFWAYLNAINVTPDEDWSVPFEIGARYESQGFKPGDAFIAAYAEWIGCEVLVSENRDFLVHAILPFRILKADAFVKEFSTG